MASTSLALAEQYPNVIPFKVVEKEVKHNKDGTVRRVAHNKCVGQESEVYAFRSKEEIKAMIDVFDKHIAGATNSDQRQIACRNKLLFMIGINVGIRASDLRSIRYSYFFNADKTFKDFYVIQPKKQRKYKKFVKLFFNDTIKTAINNYIAEYPYKHLDDYIFASRKGDEPICEQSLWRIIKDTAREAGIKQNIGSHSLRKTFAYHIWHEATDKNKALVMLQQIFNHSNTITTMKYIGLMDEEMSDIYNNLNLGQEFL